jgi:arabinose-5-phosphate isomerase
MTSTKTIKEIAQEVFATEIAVLEDVQNSLDENFENAVKLISEIKGRLVVTGMGKSGHIASKIAATLASTGTPSFFVHPAEMGHGDLGMLKKDDAVLALSFSGNTEELRKVLAPIKKLGLAMISITGGKNSILAEYSDFVLHTPVAKEACPLDLAPSSSTTAALVMGDALAIALMKIKNIQKEDFAASHPLGSLGRSFIQVSKLMRSKSIPQVQAQSVFAELVTEIDDKGLGFALVVDAQAKVLGVVTDGDIRRASIKFQNDLFTKTATDLMNKNPKTIEKTAFASRAAEIMKEYRISSLVVVDEQNQAIGILDLKDMLAEGFVI